MGKIYEALKKAAAKREKGSDGISIFKSESVFSDNKACNKESKNEKAFAVKGSVSKATPFQALQGRAFDPHLILLTDPFSYISEQYKALCVSLQRLNEDGKGIFLISSAFVQEGKTLTSISLALAMAQDMRKRTLLIDCDLRRPAVHTYLNLERKPGLTDLLLLKDMDDALNPSFVRRFENLSVLPAGDPPRNPVEVLSSQKMRELMKALRREYDVILIDSPPLIPVVDSRIVLDMADAMLLVVKAGRTKFKLLEKGVRSIKSDKILGVVLNRIQLDSSSKSYYKHYYTYTDSK